MITQRTIDIATRDLYVLGYQLKLVHAPCHLPRGADRNTTHQAGSVIYVDGRLVDGYLAHEVGHALEYEFSGHTLEPGLRSVDWNFYRNSRYHAKRERMALELQKAWSRLRGVDGSGYEGTYPGDELLKPEDADRIVRSLLL